MVRNVTDVDDSILAKARDIGIDYQDLAAREMELFHADLAALDLRPATAEPTATGSVDGILDLIGRLEAGGHTYAVEGNTYFDVSTWDGFGSMTGLDEATMLTYAADRGGNPDADSYTQLTLPTILLALIMFVVLSLPPICICRPP